MLKLALGRNRIAYLIRGGGPIAVIVWLLWPTAVLTQSVALVGSPLTEKLGYYGDVWSTQTMNTTGANLLVACVSSHHSVQNVTVADSMGNSWNLAASGTEFWDGDIRLFYSVPTATSTTHKFRVNGSDGVMASINVTAWSGAAAGPLDDTAAAAPDHAVTSIQPGLVTPSQNNEILISCLTNAHDSSNMSRSINGGFTVSGQIGFDETNYSMSIAGAYLVQTTATDANPTWSFSVNDAANAVIATFKTGESGGGGGGLSSKPMLNSPTDLTLVGGFRTPDVPENRYSGRALAYHDGKLYMATDFGLNSKVLQMDLPTQYTSDTATMQIVDQAQPAADITDGNMLELHSVLATNPDYYRNWGLLAHGGRLIGSAYSYYDSANTTRVSHFAHSLTLDQSSFEGWMALWNNEKTGFVSGPMAAIPDYAQAELGNKPVIATGAGRASIITRLPYGLAAFSFDPIEITGRAASTITEVVPLMYFDEANAMQNNFADACAVAGPGGCSNDPSEIWNRATSIGGVVIPTGTRTLLYFGRQGTGDYCYGRGTGTEGLHGQRIAPEDPENLQHYCYDPAEIDGQGEHAWPYRFQVWAFDLQQLAEVSAQTRSPWDVDYVVWPLDLPAITTAGVDSDLHKKLIGGVAYDPANKAIYVTQIGADPRDYANRPVVWKFTHP